MWKQKRILLGVVTILFCVTNLNAQKITVKLADKAFLDFSWNEAINLYSYAYSKDSTNVWVIRQLAKSYKNIGKTEETEKWFKRLIDMDQYVPDDYFEYALALKSNGKYKDAEAALSEYATMKPEDGRVNLQQSLLEYINFLIADSSRYVVKSVPFNTKGSDWGPVVYENKLVYVSTGDPDASRDIKYNWDQLPFLDLYSVDVDEYGNFSKASIFAKNLMTSFHEGPATFDVQQKRMYYNSNRTSKNAVRKEDENNLQIYMADYVNGEWQDRGGFKYNNELYNLRHPSIDATGQVLFFSSDMPGGKGGHDIYWCRKENGEWSEPVNLAEVNSEGEEMFPFIAPDGVLYFSSNGHAGMGGLDIYMAIPHGGVYSEIEPLGYPVNTSSDDFGIWLDEVGMHGYFSSNRPGGLGFDDIYKLDILWIPVVIKGVVRDRINSFEIPGAKVALLDENMDTVGVEISKEDGEFIFRAFKQRNYRLVVSKEDFVTAEKDVSTYNKKPNEKIEVDVFIEMNFDLMEEPDDLEPLSMEEMGGQELQIIQIEHINYAYDSDKILPEAAHILDKVVDLVTQYPDLEIMVESHTDSKGSDEYNLKLSKKRAVSAFEYLKQHGINPAKIEYNGFGETQLLNHCENGEECSEEEHAINRRSIIKVIRRGQYKPKRSTRSTFYF